MQSFTFQDEDRTTVIVFLLQSIKDPPQELSFAACFYCTGQCTDFLFGVCIVFVDDGGYLGTLSGPIPQVVWSANRGHLVRENATLSFTASGDLQLRDIDGVLVWSTGTSELSVARMTVTKSGNLVLFDRNNVPVWQSLDHPTDSLLPGQPLVEGMRLTPNVSATNWTISNQLYITIRADGLYAFVESSPPQLYYQKMVTQAENRKTYMALTNGSLVAMWCLQIDYNKRPQMSVVVKVLEGVVNVESDIEFNFVATVPSSLGNDGKMASLAPALASHLSGSR